MRSLLCAVTGGLFLLFSCSQKDKKGNFLDTTTSGHVKIAVDESLKPLLDTELDTFEALYTRANIDIIYTSEENAMNLLLNDSVRLAIITRGLLAPESEIMKSLMLEPSQVAIAKEGIATIFNKQNPDSVITTTQLKDILTGKIATWSQLRKGGSKDSIQVVFDQPTSGIVRYFKDSLKIDQLARNCFALKGNPEVIDYIATRRNAIGVIGVSWISDADDSTTNVFLNTVRVGGVARDTGEYYQPYQAYIAQRQYPLTRDIIVINREGRAGLGSGFLAFLAGEKGQRIILKAGLVPNTMPVRIVQIRREPLQN
jgi:phosphate transport system substrate-binding protein